MVEIPEELLASFPPLGVDPDTPLRETLVHARFFDPASSWQWYVIEFDGHETFFGLILSRRVAVAGQFTLTELSSIDAHPSDDGPGIILDTEFQPKTVAELGKSTPAVLGLLAEPIPREINKFGDLVDLDDSP
jgi:hypothetical protein